MTTSKPLVQSAAVVVVASKMPSAPRGFGPQLPPGYDSQFPLGVFMSQMPRQRTAVLVPSGFMPSVYGEPATDIDADVEMPAASPRSGHSICRSHPIDFSDSGFIVVDDFVKKHEIFERFGFAFTVIGAEFLRSVFPVYTRATCVDICVQCSGVWF